MSRQRATALVIVISYLSAVAGLGMAAAWLLSPAPDLGTPDVVMFYDLSEQDSFTVEFRQYGDGHQLVLVQNTRQEQVTVNVELTITAADEPTTFAQAEMPRDDKALPAISQDEPAVNQGRPCTISDIGYSRLRCTFTLSPTGFRAFVWRHPQRTWVAHRGSRWSAQTPYVRTNIGMPFAVDDEFLQPKFHIIARLPLPKAAAVVSGPQLTWDWNENAARFSMDGQGQISAPLIVDYDAQRREDFSTFLIAALLGAALGAFPQVASSVRPNLQR